MEKLYAVLTDYEHDKVGVPSVLFGDYFVVTHSVLFVHVRPICLQELWPGLGVGSVVEQLSCIPETLWGINKPPTNVNKAVLL